MGLSFPPLTSSAQDGDSTRDKAREKAPLLLFLMTRSREGEKGEREREREMRRNGGGGRKEKKGRAEEKRGFSAKTHLRR